MKYLAALSLVIIMQSISVAADYMTVGLGASVWPRTSNSDELEASAMPGPAFAVTLGHELSDTLSRELTFSYARNDVHGINIPGHDHLSGDGNRLHAASMHGVMRLDYFKRGPLTASVSGGVGVTCIRVRYEYDDSGRAISDNDFAPSIMLNTGARFDLSNSMDLSISYLYTKAADMQISWANNRLNTEYSAHSLIIGLHF